MTKIISYNVNGIRAALNKNWLTWLKAANPDIICIQEIKAKTEQLDLPLFDNSGYHHYWFSAEKKGYSGVAIFTKQEPIYVEYGCGIDYSDAEGRTLRVDFNDFSVMSVYAPSGTMGEERQAFKMRWLSDFQDYINTLKIKNPNLILSGDFNICHQPIDIHDPIRNANSSGFLPEEREWIGNFIDNGFIDSFRYFNKNPHHYSWWSYRANARAKNLGWRIDYNFVSYSLKNKLKSSVIFSEAKHSDHCPVFLELEI